MKLFFVFCVMIGSIINVNLHAQNVGVGTDSPVEFFSVGASSQFRVNANGNLVRINDIQYNFPAVQGAANTVLINDGTGNLSWSNTPALAVSNFSGTLPALNGSNLTNLNAANLASGTVPTARLGSGTANNTTFLRGDGSWQTPAGGGGASVVADFTDNSTLTIGASEAAIAFNGTSCSNGVFTASASGIYLFTIELQMSANTAKVIKAILNGAVTVYTSCMTVTTTAPSASPYTFVLQLSVGDTVTLNGIATSNVNVNKTIVRIVKL